jgi:hypothetical protein
VWRRVESRERVASRPKALEGPTARFTKGGDAGRLGRAAGGVARASVPAHRRDAERRLTVAPSYPSGLGARDDLVDLPPGGGRLTPPRRNVAEVARPPLGGGDSMSEPSPGRYCLLRGRLSLVQLSW